MFDEAQNSLAAKRMEKYVDRDRRPLEFQVRDRVLMKLTPQIWKKISSKTKQRGLIPKYDGLFEFEEAVQAYWQTKSTRASTSTSGGGFVSPLAS
ncbi:hypothetical protein AAG906_039019 [Vitis piasezkii]